MGSVVASLMSGPKFMGFGFLTGGLAGIRKLTRVPPA